MNVNNPNNSSETVKDMDRSYQIFDLNKMDFRIILSGEQSKGKYSLLEMDFLAEGDQEIPLHIHSKENIIVYVLEGNFIFKYGSHTISSQKEKILVLNKSIPHSYRKIGKNKGSLLIMFIPSGFEHFFSDLGLTHRGGVEERKEEQVLLHLLEKKYGGKFVFQ